MIRRSIATSSQNRFVIGANGCSKNTAKSVQIFLQNHSTDARNTSDNPIAIQRKSFSSSSSSAAPAAESSIKLLPGCIKQLKKLLTKDPDRVLRLTVNSGGCSGYSYEFKMDKTINEDDDTIIEQEGCRLVVDSLSLEFLSEDCEIDYAEEMIRASFVVAKNSNAENGCGCGASFSVISDF